ncbi:hypothetical protein D9M72_159800 [compost metagenome]
MLAHATGSTGRSPGWQVVIHCGLPGIPSDLDCMDSLLTVAGAATARPCSLLGWGSSGERQRPMKGAIMPALPGPGKRLPVGSRTPLAFSESRSANAALADSCGDWRRRLCRPRQGRTSCPAGGLRGGGRPASARPAAVLHSRPAYALAQPLLAGDGAGTARHADLRAGQRRSHAVRCRRQPRAAAAGGRTARDPGPLVLFPGSGSPGLAIAGGHPALAGRPSPCGPQCPSAPGHPLAGAEQRRQQPGRHRRTAERTWLRPQPDHRAGALGRRAGTTHRRHRLRLVRR